MPVLTLAAVRHQYGTRIVLDGVTLSIEPGEKVGLVGRNGCGKTTLLRVMRGRLAPDQGVVQLQRGARVGYLSQDPELEAGDTVRDAAERAFAELHRLHGRMHQLYEAMAGAGEAEMNRLLRRQAHLEGKIEAAGGYAVDHRIDAMLHGLGFTDAQFALAAADLSGGQKGRLALARLLLEAPDVLLLDEPTNHLDIAGRQWLERFLGEDYGGAVVVVSHDRWLLDRVVHRIIEIEQGVLRNYPGNYHKYRALRRERQLTQVRVHEKQLDRIRQEERFIARYKSGQRAKQARGRQSRLERFKREQLVERPVEIDAMRLQLPAAPRSGELVLGAEGLTKAYGDLTLFRDFGLTLARGERLGIIGPNGIGKTTLVRCLLGELEPDAGTVWRGARVRAGYYRQLHEDLDRSLTVWQYLQSVLAGRDGTERASEQQARDLAGAFLFSGEEQEKTLADLSGGERSRAVLAGLVGGAHNVLVLDEPTNHLDLPSAERLEQALSREGGYQGALVLISHDRALLEATCDALIVFESAGAVRFLAGRYSDWERRLEGAGTGRERPAAEGGGPQGRSRRNDRGARPAPAGRRRAANPLAHLDVEELEARIEGLEGRVKEIDASMLDPAVYSDRARCRELAEQRAALKRELAPLEREWTGRG